MSDDHSPGDRRNPYSDQGGPAGRHAQTHDVRREELTNPKGPEPEDTSFAEQLAPEATGGPQSHVDESFTAAEDKVLYETLPGLSAEELDRLSVLDAGVRLEQGGTYVDLNRLADGPFKALAGRVVNDGDRVIAKRDTEYELWNRIVGSDAEAEIERPSD
jgi:hypothetical protein